MKFIPAIIEWLVYDPFPVGKTFGEKLLWRRKIMGLTRAAFAERLSASYSTVQQWERGVYRPPNANMVKVKRLLGIDVARGNESLQDDINGLQAPANALPCGPFGISSLDAGRVPAVAALDIGVNIVENYSVMLNELARVF